MRDYLNTYEGAKPSRRYFSDSKRITDADANDFNSSLYYNRSATEGILQSNTTYPKF